MPPRPMPTRGEIAVIGLGKSGAAAVKLLRKNGYQVYASDASSSDATNVLATTLEAAGADVTVGSHDLERIQRAALVVLSPGVPPNAPPVVAAREHGVEIISEIELALRCMRTTPYIAVTGTNGKTTTTALIGHILRALGHTVADAGNIGTPLTEIAYQETPPDWIALELSSFQLHDTPSIDPTVGVLTNLTPDHLDRYPSVDEYYADKMLLFANATSESNWVLNADDPVSLAHISELIGTQHYFSILPTLGASRVGSTNDAASEASDVGGPNAARPRPDAWYNHDTNTLTVLATDIINRDELPLIGDHNVANALAATLAVMSASPTHRTPESASAIKVALQTFHAPPHRLELAGEWNGIQWINDSKATNVSSTYVAIDGMTRPTILLLGGRHKGEPYTALAAPIKSHVKRVIAYGESAELVEHDLRDIVPVDRLTSDFESVIAHARALAAPGDAVLLSPACSSYDMFNNYEERGARFRELAQQVSASTAESRAV